MIKTTITTTFILLFTLNSYSQQVNDSLIIGFFNKTFTDYFISRDSLLHDFYILNDSVPYDVKTDYKDFKLHLIDYNQAYPLIKKDEISSLYWARLKQISVDTVDIVIGGWTVDFERVFRFQKIKGKRKIVLRNYNFAAWCGGTLGYIPQGRFVYLPELDKWDYIPERTIIDNKLKKYRLK